MTRSLVWMSLLLVACEPEECPDVDCSDSLTVVVEGAVLLDSWTVILTDEDSREESFKCYGQEVRNLTDDSLLVWCETEGFTLAGWTMETLTIRLEDKDGTYTWDQSVAWEADYPHGEECPAACDFAEMTLFRDGSTGDSG